MQHRQLRRIATTSALAGALLASMVPAVSGAQSATAATPAYVSAKTLLSKLHVARESHASAYSRAKFKVWIDANNDCENTRAEVLKGESTSRVTKTSTGCDVNTGKWVSRYDGKTYLSAANLGIDHLVPLAEAWTSGAYKWTARKRTAYANDLGYGASLIAVSRHAIRSKGDHEPNAYLPPAKSYRCSYVRNWIAVKYRWRLSINSLEKTRLAQDLATYCSSTRVLRPATPNLTKLSGIAAPTTGTTTPTNPIAGSGTASPSAPAAGGVDALGFPKFEAEVRSGQWSGSAGLPSRATAGMVYFLNRENSYGGPHSTELRLQDSAGQTLEYLVGDLGDYYGTVAYGLNGLGGAPASFSVSSGGRWSVEVKPLSSAPELPDSDTNDGVFTYNGAARDATFTYSGAGNFAVWQYTGPGKGELLINDIGRTTRTVHLVGGPSIVVVTASGSWTQSAPQSTF